jgi:putative endonuclease
MSEHNEKGKYGEKLAQEYLINHGYKIRHTNWRARRYEIDIIAQKNDILMFCEVKYRSSNMFGEPESFVTIQKQKNIIKAAASYVGRVCWQGESRFDIISILEMGKTIKINHIEDAYGSRW